MLYHCKVGQVVAPQVHLANPGHAVQQAPINAISQTTLMVHTRQLLLELLVGQM